MTSAVLMVVPTLGRRIALLDQALGTIRNQGMPVDIVIVAPDTPQIQALVAAHNTRFVVDPECGGQSGALNAGLAAAHPASKYFAWLCDDDRLTPGSLRSATQALEHRPEAAMVYGWCDYIDEHGTVVFASRAGRAASLILRWGPNLIPQPGSLMRLEQVREVGGIDEECRLTMDLDLFLRLKQLGPLICLPRTLAEFRWHADSLTVSQQDASMDEADQVRQRYMRPLAARAYKYLRWPGRWALLLAKRRVGNNVKQRARA